MEKANISFRYWIHTVVRSSSSVITDETFLEPFWWWPSPLSVAALLLPRGGGPFLAVLVPSWTILLHMSFLRAASSQLLRLKRHFLRWVLLLSLYRLFCPPWDALSFLQFGRTFVSERHLLGMRMTWPVHRSWCRVMVVVMLGVLASFKTLMLVRLSSIAGGTASGL